MTTFDNNPALPIIDNPAQINITLANPRVASVILREPFARHAATAICLDAQMETDRVNALRYISDPDEEFGRRITGKRGYKAPLIHDDLLWEQNYAFIKLSPVALRLLQLRINELRELFIKVARTHTKAEPEIVTWVLMAPKGGLGRTPEIHVDNTYLTMHSSFNAAALELYTGIDLPDHAWDLINRAKHDPRKMTPDELTIFSARKKHITTEYSSEFCRAAVADVIIMKGQKDRNLDDPVVRRSVTPHTSSLLIPTYGQIGMVMTCSKILSTSPELASN